MVLLRCIRSIGMDFYYLKLSCDLFSKMWSQEQMIVIVELWHKYKSVALVQWKFAQRFGLVGRAKKNVPNYKMIMRVVERFHKKGSIFVRQRRSLK